MNISRLHILLLFCIFPYCAWSQAEIEQERNSLHGLQGVGFNVNIEQKSAFADTQLVKMVAVRSQGLQKLKQNKIHIFSDKEVASSVRIPVLYLHINSLSTSDGIISFAISATLYQPVKLVLNRDKQTTAATWESSTVGIASYDKIGVIKQAAMGIIQNFIDDYYKVNSN